MKSWKLRLTLAVLVVGSAALFPSGGKAQEKRPQVAGAWTGTWGVYSPPKPGQAAANAAPASGQKTQKYSQRDMALDCKVVELEGGKWQATFEGECGRPYKYTVQMQGRQAGSVVLFQGTADLGEKDGGVYDWIGRANDEEFVGFFTSQKYTGHFRLQRARL
jgi:hypothetical protein